MSQYTHIFLEKQNTFIEVSCTGRSHVLSEMFYDYAPWEKVHLMTFDQLSSIYHKYANNLKDWHDHRDELSKRVEIIATCNNSIEDKMEAWNDLRDEIADVDETIEALNAALVLLNQLRIIVSDSAQSSQVPIHVYVGVECGSDVTVDDVEGSGADTQTESSLSEVNMFDGDIR